ncbi:MAG: hypothetical protein M1541_16935, partial [Acidobacteria bacterium]|nr:hypothetical protein [Acidobacteriota bacterium]
EPFALEGSPTRFGRLALELAPAGKGWRLKFSRGKGPAPERLRLPARLGCGGRVTEVSGAEASVQGESVAVTPGASSWEAVWAV